MQSLGLGFPNPQGSSMLRDSTDSIESISGMRICRSGSRKAVFEGGF